MAAARSSSLSTDLHPIARAASLRYGPGSRRSLTSIP